MKRKLRIRSLTIAVGIMLAMVMTLTQLFQTQVSGFGKKEAKTEQRDHHGDETFISLSSFSLPSASVYLQVNLDPYCLFEILFEKEPQQPEASRVPLHPEKLLQTLFRVIISPNAP
jgi:hypothetical protein